MRSLVGIEYIRYAMFLKGFFQGIYAERCIEGI